MKSDRRHRGVYVILVTPFDDQGRIDEESLRAEVDFCIETGAHGLVTPANASEFFTLSDLERKSIGDAVIDQCAGRLPVIISVTGASAPVAVEYVRIAQEAGADGLMAMPPPIRTPTTESIVAYFEAIAAAARVPIIVQNSVFVGSPMRPELLARLVDNCDGIHYIKEESDPCTHVATRITQLVTNKGNLHGIFGGLAGRHLMNEMARGICGTMPAAEVPDVHSAVWNAFERGDVAEARRLFNRLLPLLNMESLYPLQLYKEVLRRRGVIRRATLRNNLQSPLDEIDHRELDAILSDIEDLLVVTGPFS